MRVHVSSCLMGLVLAVGLAVPAHADPVADFYKDRTVTLIAGYSAGGGFDLYLGGRVNSWLALELGWQPTFHNPEYDAFGRRVGRIEIQAVTFDLKFFPTRGRVQPYFVVGGGGYLLGDNFDVFAAGPGFQAGAGLDIWLMRHLSLGLRAQYRGVALVDYDPANDDTYISMLSAGADITVRF